MDRPCGPISSSPSSVPSWMQDIISCIEELDERVRMEMEQDAISRIEVPVAPHGAEFLRKRAEMDRIEARPWSSKRAKLDQ